MTEPAGLPAAFQLMAGQRLVFRVGDGRWQEVEFRAADFADLTRAQPDELAQLLGGVGGLVARVDDGELVLESPDTGSGASVEFDLEASTGAPALSLAVPGSPAATAHGTGPGPARLTGTAQGPFALPAKARMTVRVDGRNHRVLFAGDAGPQSAEDVAAKIDASVRRRVARVTGDDRIALTSPTIGPSSTLEVLPAPAGTPDAAEVLGLVGEHARSHPWRSEPARLRLSPPAASVTIINLSAAPLELHLATGQTIVPARGRLAVDRRLAADPAVARLAGRGLLAVSPATMPETDPG
jgi:hypothetical protein